MSRERTTSGLIRYVLYLGSLGFGEPVALSAKPLRQAAVRDEVAALVLLWRFKIPEPILIVGAGLIGFAIFWLRGAA